MSAEQDQTKAETRDAAAEQGSAPPVVQSSPAAGDRLAAKAMELLEELTEDNVSMLGMLNRVLEGQASARDALAREVDTVRQDLAGATVYRALKDLCKELSTPLGALQAMLRDGDFSDPKVVREHVSALAQTIESVLARMGAEQIRVNLGQDLFNPEVHFCMRLVSPEESPFPSAPPRTIVGVFENGYVLAGRLLSPARVEVQSESKAASTEVGR